MPNYRGHLVGGLVTFALLFFGVVGVHVSFLTACEWLLCTLAGSLFPDVDTKSKGQKYFYYVVCVLFVFLALKQRFHLLSCCSFLFMAPMLVHHRTVFHSQRFVMMAPLIVWVVVSVAVPDIAVQFFFDTLFFIAGALSHIWLDFGIIRMLRRLIR